VLHTLAGRTLIDHVLKAVEPLGAASTVVVVGHGGEEVKSALAGRAGLQFAVQSPQLGTGHAVMCARETLRDFAGDLLVLPGDVPLIRTETIQEFLRFHREGNYDASILTAEIANCELGNANCKRIIRL
jgi:bifunctional UDP-N-acetylglucosamine pyrophosphorylase/glucosamine-1-phosphate N-acetyltransferase